PFTRNQVIRELESHKIATRLLFGGNLVRQPAYQNMPYRIAAPLTNTDFIMNQVFWIGVYPGLTPPMLDFVVGVLHGMAQNAPQ
ncbi:MAG: DegT/DnrJ/EryC1/StrS family aminotransferase, partial [Terriglobia bacterium]